MNYIYKGEKATPFELSDILHISNSRRKLFDDWFVITEDFMDLLECAINEEVCTLYIIKFTNI